MAVYEHLYGAYEGESHSAWSRFLVIPRYALREVFKSKLLVTIFILCFIYPLVATILVYLHHNANALALLQINVRELLPIDASFFRTFLEVQGAICVYSDGARRAAAHLARFVEQRSAALFVPPAFARRIRARQDGGHRVSAVADHVDSGFADLLFSGVARRLRVVLGESVDDSGDLFRLHDLDYLAVFARARRVVARSNGASWRAARCSDCSSCRARSARSSIELFLTRTGHLISLWATMNSIWRGLFGLFERQTGRIRGRVTNPIYNEQFVDIALLEPPLWASWLVIALVCAVCVWLLSRKVRAYEVIK